jgi:hypothetical protein
MAYNQQHQLKVVKQITEFIDSNHDVRLLVVNNITVKIQELYGKYVKGALGIICKVCARNKVALVCIGERNVTSRGLIPRPIGGTFLKHSINVIIHLKECSVHHPLIFKATLIKHQYSKTPKSVIINTRKTGRMLLLD